MAEQVKVLATKPDDLHSSTTTSRVEGASALSSFPLTLHTHCGTDTFVHTHTIFLTKR